MKHFILTSKIVRKMYPNEMKWLRREAVYLGLQIYDEGKLIERGCGDDYPVITPQNWK